MLDGPRKSRYNRVRLLLLRPIAQHRCPLAPSYTPSRDGVSSRRSSAWLLARGFGRPYGSCEPPWKSVIANKSQPISPGVELKPDCDYDRPVRRGRYTECGGAALRVLAPSPFSPWLVSSPPGLSRSLALRDGFAFGWGVRAAWA